MIINIIIKRNFGVDGIFYIRVIYGVCYIIVDICEFFISWVLNG